MSSNKSKRLDSKSPYSPYIERESNKDYDNLSHSKPLSKSKRPASAKNNETRSGKTLR